MRILIVLLFAVVACSGGSSSTPARTFSVPENRIGSYSFAERVETTRGQTMALDGDFEVTSDSVIVSTVLAACQYEITSTRAGPIVYRCGDVVFTFDRLDPVNRASYRMNVRYTEQQSVCAQYATDAQGRSRCVSYRTDMVERTAVRTGRLNPHREPGR